MGGQGLPFVHPPPCGFRYGGAVRQAWHRAVGSGSGAAHPGGARCRPGRGDCRGGGAAAGSFRVLRGRVDRGAVRGGWSWIGSRSCSVRDGRAPAAAAGHGAAARGRRGLGTGASIALFAPSQAGDPAARQAQARFERASASPAMARALVESLALTDVERLLPGVSVPTLVVHRTQDIVPVEEGRFIASRVARSRLAELPGADHRPWIGDSQAVISEIERCLPASSTSSTPAWC
jgi:pimeloyl-ACP methyl ester carboxylesterase